MKAVELKGRWVLAMCVSVSWARLDVWQACSVAYIKPLLSESPLFHQSPNFLHEHCVFLFLSLTILSLFFPQSFLSLTSLVLWSPSLFSPKHSPLCPPAHSTLVFSVFSLPPSLHPPIPPSNSFACLSVCAFLSFAWGASFTWKSAIGCDMTGQGANQ